MIKLPGIEQRLKSGVEFSDRKEDSEYCGVNLDLFDFSQKTVVDFTGKDSHLVEGLVARGADAAYLCSLDESSAVGNQIEIWKGDIWDFPKREIDFAFFDPRMYPDFDYVADTRKIVKRLELILASAGSCFILLRSGVVQSDWDVFNSVLLTSSGRLPSSPYLYSSLLGGFAVRPLIRVHEECSAQCVTRVFRISPRSKTLLMIVGHSQSGKTTLARNLLTSRPGSHLSSDYVYFNLYQIREQLAESSDMQLLGGILGNATAEDTGNFFRNLEKDSAALQEYLELVGRLLPNDDLVSMDIDLRSTKQIRRAKQIFETMGYLVWIVSR